LGRVWVLMANPGATLIVKVWLAADDGCRLSSTVTLNV
jgi:hypothetical protein